MGPHARSKVGVSVTRRNPSERVPTKPASQVSEPFAHTVTTRIDSSNSKPVGIRTSDRAVSKLNDELLRIHLGMWRQSMTKIIHGNGRPHDDIFRFTAIKECREGSHDRILTVLYESPAVGKGSRERR